MLYNDDSIYKADNFTLEVLEDTYLNMEIALPRNGEGLEFTKVTKRLRDVNGIPISTANNNPILDTCLYEIEYLDSYKASLTANTIAENIFVQIDNEDHCHVLQDNIANHRVDGSKLKDYEVFICSCNGGKCRKETTKGWEILLQ